MAFDPFNSPSRDFFGESRFTDHAGQTSAMAADVANSVVNNKNYVLAAQRASQYRKQLVEDERMWQKKQSEQRSRSGLFGTIGSVLGGAIGSVGGPIGSKVGAAIGGSLGSRIG
jgi:hypothetical protein